MIFLFCLFFRAIPMAHGSSQARGKLELWLLACHPNLIYDPYDCSWQCQKLNPLSEARDQTCVLMDTSQAHYC